MKKKTSHLKEKKGGAMDQLEERAVLLAQYIIENNATVRQAAAVFGVSKSTVHKDVTKWNGYGCFHHIVSRFCDALSL